MAIKEASSANAAAPAEELKPDEPVAGEETSYSAVVIIMTGALPVGPDEIGIGAPGDGTPITEEVHAAVTATEETRAG